MTVRFSAWDAQQRKEIAAVDRPFDENMDWSPLRYAIGEILPPTHRPGPGRALALAVAANAVADGTAAGDRAPFPADIRRRAGSRPVPFPIRFAARCGRRE